MDSRRKEEYSAKRRKKVNLTSLLQTDSHKNSIASSALLSLGEKRERERERERDTSEEKKMRHVQKNRQIDHLTD